MFLSFFFLSVANWADPLLQFVKSRLVFNRNVAKKTLLVVLKLRAHRRKEHIVPPSRCCIFQFAFKVDALQCSLSYLLCTVGEVCFRSLLDVACHCESALGLCCLQLPLDLVNSLEK